MTRPARILGTLWGALAVSLATGVSAAQGGDGGFVGGTLFEEVWETARDRFLDPGMNGVDWGAVRESHLSRARAAPTREREALVVNEALALLGTSHTRLYTSNERAYWELLDIFNPDGVGEGEVPGVPAGRVEYEGIGLVARALDGRVFASEVYEAGPAARAGVLVGDEIVSVGGEPWRGLAAFVGLGGDTIDVEIRRARGGETRTLEVDVDRIQPRELFLRSIDAGARTVRADGVSVGYLRVRSYAHPSYHDAVKRLTLFGELTGSDALVLDLRGGWGGASPAYLDLFNPIAPRLDSIGRDGQAHPYSATWRKPLVVLIDAGTRSGKEVLAWAIKRHGVGTLVGQRTAGAVVGGSPIVMRDGSVLYLGVRRSLVEGERLEGVGVEPDVEVAFDMAYAAGADPQLDRAVEVAAELARGTGAGG